MKPKYNLGDKVKMTRAVDGFLTNAIGTVVITPNSTQTNYGIWFQDYADTRGVLHGLPCEESRAACSSGARPKGWWIDEKSLERAITQTYNVESIL